MSCLAFTGRPATGVLLGLTAEVRSIDTARGTLCSSRASSHFASAESRCALRTVDRPFPHDILDHQLVTDLVSLHDPPPGGVSSAVRAQRGGREP